MADILQSDGSPIATQLQMQAIDRQRKLAEMLQQQSMQPEQGQMISGHYVAPHPMQYLNKLAQALVGSSNQRDLDSRALDTTNASNKFMGDQADALNTALSANPEDNSAIVKYLNATGNQGKSAEYVISNAKQQALINALTGRPNVTNQSAGTTNTPQGAPIASGAAPGLSQPQQQSAFSMLAPEEKEIYVNHIRAGKPDEAVKYMTDLLKPQMSSDGKMFIRRNGQVQVMPGSVDAFSQFKNAENASTPLDPKFVDAQGRPIGGTVGGYIRGQGEPQGAAQAGEAFQGAALLDQLPPEVRAGILANAKSGDGKFNLDYQLPNGKRISGAVNLGGADQSSPQGIGQTTAGKQQQESQGKFFGDTYSDIQKKAYEANNNIGNYSRLGQLLDGVETGKFTGSGLEIKKAAKAAGIDLGVADNIAPLEAARALTSQMALVMRNPDSGMGMPGAMSDADRSFLVNMQPGIETTPQGRKLMMDAGIKIEQRKQEIAKLAREYKGGNLDNGFFEAVQQYSNSHPLFDGMKAPASPPSKQDQPKASKLPAGWSVSGG